MHRSLRRILIAHAAFMLAVVAVGCRDAEPTGSPFSVSLLTSPEMAGMRERSIHPWKNADAGVWRAVWRDGALRHVLLQRGVPGGLGGHFQIAVFDADGTLLDQTDIGVPSADGREPDLLLQLSPRIVISFRDSEHPEWIRSYVASAPEEWREGEVELVDSLERKVAELEEKGSDPEAVLALNAWVKELRDAQERARSHPAP